MANIIIDLTPLRPGGENGGAKPMVLDLVKQLGKLNPTDCFTLLTANISHDELSFLDADNISRLCVTLCESKKEKPPNPYFLGSRFLRRALNFLRRKLPYLSWMRPQKRKLFNKLTPDLIFCPFTAPFFILPNVPIVSIVYDVQFLIYPYFFSTEVQIERMQHFKRACEKASRLICISQFTQQSVLKYAPTLNKEHTTVIPIHIPSEWIQQELTENASELLSKYQLEFEKFLLYPANFWAHKNHKVLLTAFALFRKKHPLSSLKLVCTGAPETGQAAIKSAAELMGIASYVVFPGYVSANDLRGLMLACKALIFPSLYEGFGIPIIEAMLLGKLVLCSQQEALQEIGENAMFFHPGKPQEIAKNIEEIEDKFELLRNNISEKYQKTWEYLGTEKMARAYSEVFADVINQK